jgi:hypothetical protein
MELLPELTTNIVIQLISDFEISDYWYQLIGVRIEDRYGIKIRDGISDAESGRRMPSRLENVCCK